MSVCAVLVNYHGASEIFEAVKSVQADSPGIEIVVVDNSDDAQEWMRLETLLPQSVRKVRAPGNIGFGQGCNLAVEHTQASFIFLVNPDVRLLPGCMQGLQNALLVDPRLSAVSPRQYLDKACQWLLPPSWLPTALRHWVTERAMREPLVAARLGIASYAENLRFFNASQPIRQRALSGGAIMIRRSSLLRGEKLFDPRYFMYFEDTDLCMRLRRRGWHLAVVPTARAVHAWRNQPHKAPLMANSAEVYFDKFFGKDNEWLSKSRTIGHKAITAPYSFLPFPAQGVHLPTAASHSWLLELSPSPLIQPAIAYLGHGPHVREPLFALSHFEASPVFARLSSFSSAKKMNDSQFFHWHSHSDGI